MAVHGTREGHTTGRMVMEGVAVFEGGVDAPGRGGDLHRIIAERQVTLHRIGQATQTLRSWSEDLFGLEVPPESGRDEPDAPGLIAWVLFLDKEISEALDRLEAELVFLGRLTSDSEAQTR